MAKKVELVVVKSCPFVCQISVDLTTLGVSVKTLVDHIECGTIYDNSLIDYTIITQYLKEKLQSDRKYKVKEMNADLHKTLDGSSVNSYNKLEVYTIELRSCNSGSNVVINLFKGALSIDKRKFLRMYTRF
ncbi:hypothetical protein H5410_015754 [Solanum commersonii]|uniref:Uncharacterized protein n=1 Tax=Solanum commersonii TaxID=4109 RepID=A0A9J5ZVC3_SOLCO|nr:hypothetical protein H5410_015754 [Solanum commersonii]